MNLHILFCEGHSVMDHNYMRDEENEEEILRGIWENAHPDDGGDDAINGTNAGGEDVGTGTDQAGPEDDDDFTSQFLIGGEGLESTKTRADEVYMLRLFCSSADAFIDLYCSY